MLIVYLLSILLSLGANALAADSSENSPPTNQPENNAILSPEQLAQFQKQISQWRTDHLTPMAPQQLQIIANIAYLLYANILCDLSTRTYLPALVFCAQKIQEKLQAGQDSTQELALLKTLTDKLQVISNKRSIIGRTLQETNNYINSNAQNQLFQQIMPALQSLQLYSQQLLLMYANNAQQEIDDYMTATAETLNNIVQSLNSAATMFKKPQELKNLLPDVLPNNQELAKIEVATKVAQGIATCGWENITIAQNTMQYLTQLLRVAQIAYGSYYQATYNYMKTRDGNRQYTTHMFDEKGLLPAEYRKTPLPAPQELAQQFSMMQSSS